ncbi:hypothetical protein [Nonomuraea rubra]|uniref:hypothetical protein n=1 Tax=Nonomuraea rubra TaxID=46180 RepID=UPI0031EBBBBD
MSYHFAGKDELMEQVVEHTYGAVAEHVFARMTASRRRPSCSGRTSWPSPSTCSATAPRSGRWARSSATSGPRTATPATGCTPTRSSTRGSSSSTGWDSGPGSSGSSTCGSWPSRSRRPSTTCSPTGSPIPATTSKHTPPNSPT